MASKAKAGAAGKPKAGAAGKAKAGAKRPGSKQEANGGAAKKPKTAKEAAAAAALKKKKAAAKVPPPPISLIPSLLMYSALKSLQSRLLATSIDKPNSSTSDAPRGEDGARAGGRGGMGGRGLFLMSYTCVCSNRQWEAMHMPCSGAFVFRDCADGPIPFVYAARTQS